MHFNVFSNEKPAFDSSIRIPACTTQGKILTSTFNHTTNEVFIMLTKIIITKSNSPKMSRLWEIHPPAFHNFIGIKSVFMIFFFFCAMSPAFTIPELNCSLVTVADCYEFTLSTRRTYGWKFSNTCQSERMSRVWGNVD